MLFSMRLWPRRSIPGAARAAAAACLVLSLCLPAARAAERVDLYTAEVPLLPGVADPRERAYADALDAVIARIVPFEARAEALALFESPARWVQGWREGDDDTLVVTFDGRAITALLRAQRVPVWGSDRPMTLVWLAIEARDGSRRLLERFEAPDPAPEDASPGATAQVPLLPAPGQPPAPQPVAFGEAVADAAQRFGIPVRLPRYDEADLAAVSVSDIWGGFSNVIVEASARYGVDSILIGRASERRPADIRWTWVFAGDESRFGGDVNVAFARVGSRLMSRFASSREGSADVRISVVAVDGLADYARLLGFVTGQGLVEEVRVLAMRGDQVLLGVDALASRERLARLLEGTVLERVEPPVLAVPFAGSAGERVLGAPDAPVTLGEIAGAPARAADPVALPGTALPGAPPPPDFEAADLYFRLRPAGGVGD